MTIGVCFFSAGSIRLVGLFPTVTAGQYYDYTIDLADDYSPPVVVDVSSGSIPIGLTLEISPDGAHARLYGTAVGDFKFDSTSAALPAAYAGQYYSYRVRLLGSSGIPTFVISSGAMPAWMSIAWHSDTNEVEFYGTPT